MAGVAGFEPAHADTKNRCLTAWLHPSTSVAAHITCLPQKGRGLAKDYDNLSQILAHMPPINLRNPWKSLSAIPWAKYQNRRQNGVLPAPFAN